MENKCCKKCEFKNNQFNTLMLGCLNTSCKCHNKLNLSTSKWVEEEKKHICCDGECYHDDCCGKILENCPNYSTQEPMECKHNLIENDYYQKFCNKCGMEERNGIMVGKCKEEEPMEWESEYYKLPEPSIFPSALENHHRIIKQFIANQIKQAEERVKHIVKAGYDSMLDQKIMMAKADERERIVKEIEKIEINDIYWSDDYGKMIPLEALIILINQNNE